MLKPSIVSVLNSGLCVGCGACKVVDSGISIVRNRYGAMEADISSCSEPGLILASKVCPWSAESRSETEISDSLFSGCSGYDDRIGFYIDMVAARVCNDDDVVRSSSGGMTTLIASALLEAGYVDGVIHVGSAESACSGLFEFVVSESVSQIEGRRKSQYYSASIDIVMERIRGDGRRYAFVGVPCYVKAVRSLCQVDISLSEQIRFFIGLVCGHMKSSAFAESMAWQVGVAPDRLRSVDFRKKVVGRPAHEYQFEATSIDGVRASGVSKDLVGGSWGHALFQLKACDFCDDIFAETADVVLGDAWIKKYVKDWRGTNVVVVRNPIIMKIMHDALACGRITMDSISVDELVESQAGNFRHRWDGLSVRLEVAQQAGEWIPSKRIKPGSRSVSDQRRKIILLRQKMASESHSLFYEAKNRHSLPFFLGAIAPMVKSMKKLTGETFSGKVFRRLSGLLRRPR